MEMVVNSSTILVPCMVRIDIHLVSGQELLELYQQNEAKNKSNNIPLWLCVATHRHMVRLCNSSGELPLPLIPSEPRDMVLRLSGGIKFLLSPRLLFHDKYYTIPFLSTPNPITHWHNHVWWHIFHTFPADFEKGQRLSTTQGTLAPTSWWLIYLQKI